jgi:hypothetical protein
MAPKSKKAEVEENPFLPPPVDLDRIPLADKDYLISETRCEFDFAELQSWFKDTFLDQSDEIGLWESNLPLYLFPQVHHFPEFSLKCQAHYLPDQRVVVSSSGETLFFITPEAIDQMMQISRAESASPFNLEILTELYQNLSFPQRAQIFELFLPQDAQLPKKNPPYHSSLFSEKGNQVISSLCCLLGYYSDEWVDEPILGFLSIFSAEEKATIQFDYNTFLAENIHDQLSKFATEGMFWYSSILAYMFTFFQAERFSFLMQKMDKDDKPQAVTSWTSLLRRNSTEFSFKQFIEQFYHPVVSMLSGRPEPRINEEIQRILHLSDLAKMGDWYLYQNHTEIRVYGCELAPYKLPKYFPVRIFSLEYIRQMINSDDIHFVSLKKKQQLRIKGQIGSFICNSRAVGEEADKLLREMKFETSFLWHYDPCGIISEMRVKNKNIPYVHTPKPEIEKFVNQTEWEVNTLEEVEQQSPSVIISQTTTPQVPKEKRPRKDTSPSVTEVSAEDFQVHTKRPKASHTTDTTGEKETQSTTVMKGDHSPLISSNQQIMSTSSSKKQTDTSLVDQPNKGGAKLSIFEKYDMIKKKNQMLTNNTYAQFWKQTSMTQHRLLSSFDTEKGRMHMAFLQAQVPDPKAITDYKRETFEFNTRDVHPADQMDLHRKMGEMVFSTLANASTSAAKLQVSLNNVQTQLKLEKISSFAKDNRIKSLEELVLKIGYDPSNVKAVEEMLKKKNADIASLRKQLKLPPTEDAQAKEIAETEGEKDEMLKLIMEQNAQLREMEAELERLVKEKEHETPMEVIPLSALPLTGVSTTTVAMTTTTEIPSATPLTALEKMVELAKSMEEMNLQGTEINRLKKEVESLQELKSSYQTSYTMEKQTSENLKQELQQLQKQTVAGKTLAEAKENIWMDISKSINEIWPMVQIMFEKNELVLRSRQAIDKIKGELGEMPTEANEIIRFLNSKNKEELEDLKIEDRT